MASLGGKTLFITGGSRGIGLAIALRAARDGANVVIAAKTAEPNPKLPGTIFTAAGEIEAAGGRCLPVQCDIRDEAQLARAVAAAVDRFGGIDVLVNNASAISLTGTPETPLKRFDLMFGINVRGTFAASQACVPHLAKATNPHILTLSPPLNLNPRWFKRHVAYTMAKYGMSMCVLGMAEEFRERGIAVNALWPRTIIATAALQMIPGAEVIKVEPLEGDNTRRLEAAGAGFFPVFNRNKKSLAVDLKHPEGRALVLTLIDRSDVLTENFRPGALDKLGFSHKNLKERNPRLVYCSLKGFLKGPYEHRAALDEVTQMMGGLAYMTGLPDRPLRAGSSVIDILGGTFAALGILAALRERDKTGRGKQVTSALWLRIRGSRATACA